MNDRYTDQDLAENAEKRAEPVADCVEDFSESLNSAMRSMVQSDEYALFASRPLARELDAELKLQMDGLDRVKNQSSFRTLVWCRAVLRRVFAMPDEEPASE